MSTDEFSSIFSVESDSIAAGRLEGFSLGLSEGRREGGELGKTRGRQIGEEIGFYLGFAAALSASDGDSASAFISQLRQFPLGEPLNESLDDRTAAIRARFRVFLKKFGIEKYFKTKNEQNEKSF